MEQESAQHISDLGLRAIGVRCPSSDASASKGVRAPASPPPVQGLDPIAPVMGCLAGHLVAACLVVEYGIQKSTSKWISPRFAQMHPREHEGIRDAPCSSAPDRRMRPRRIIAPVQIRESTSLRTRVRLHL